MPLIIENLAPIGGGTSAGVKSIAAGAVGRGAPTLWAYITEDAAATVDTTGYFNGNVAFGGAYNMMNLGDVIMRVTVGSGAVSTVGWHVVKDKAAGVLDISDATAVTVATDTD